MKKTIKSGLILLAIAAISGCVSTSDNPLEIKNIDSFNRYVEVVRQDEIRAFMNNAEVRVIGMDVISISSADFIAEYKKNEGQASDKYSGKKLRVKGIASAVSGDADDKPFVKVSGKNSFGSATLYLSNTEDLIGLTKGSEIDFVCAVDVAVTLSQCLPSVSYATEEASNDIGNIYSNGKLTIRSNSDYANFVGYKVFEDALSASCAQSNQECMDALRTIMFRDDLEDIVSAWLKVNGEALEKVMN